MINNLLQGGNYVLQGFGLLTRKGIRRFVVIPLMVNIVVFTAAIWLGYQYFSSLIGRLLDWMPGWLAWLQWLIWPLVAITVLLFVYYTFTIVANLIAAPFNSLLAARTEAVLLGEQDPGGGDYESLPGIIGRTMWSEVRKILYQIKWLILLLIITVIPGVNLIAPFAWLYFGAWMLSVEYVDYPMGNSGHYFSAVKKHLKQNRMTAIGLGGGLTLIALVPVLNFIAMPLGVVSATAYWVDNR